MIPIEKGNIRSSAMSHAGGDTSNNQDRYALQSFQLKESSREESLFAVLADGVGAQRAGEVAAQIAVDMILYAVSQSEGSQPSALLQAAILRAGQAIVAQSEEEKEKRGMGTTALCAWLIDRKLFTASVGNSRLYLLRRDSLRLLNVVSETEAGNEQDWVNDPSSFLGARLRENVDQRIVLSGDRSAKSSRNQGAIMRSNDRLLLCSDGLSDALSDLEIRDILGQARIEDAAAKLVQAAIEKGSQDNLTAIAIAMPPGRPAPARRQIALRRFFRLAFASSILIIISLLGWFFWGPLLDPSYTPIATAINTLTPFP
jgi:serine/threonine protein phosphatase PrpC